MVAVRQGHRDVLAAITVAALAIVIGWLAVVRSPMSSFFGVSSDYVRWLWPASVFLWFAIALTIWRLVAPRLPEVVDDRAR